MIKHEILIAAFCAVCTSATAQTTSGHLNGIVTSIFDPNALAPSGVRVGDTVSTSFAYGAVVGSFDLSSHDRDFSFSEGNFSMTVTIGSMTWRMSSGHIEVVDEVYGDRISLITNGTPSSFPGKLGSSSNLLVNLYDRTAPYDLISSIALPRMTSDINLAALEPNRCGELGCPGIIRSSDWPDPIHPYNQWQIEYSISGLSIATVPEPTTVELVIGAMLFFLVRRKLLAK